MSDDMKVKSKALETRTERRDFRLAMKIRGCRVLMEKLGWEAQIRQLDRGEIDRKLLSRIEGFVEGHAKGCPLNEPESTRGMAYMDDLSKLWRDYHVLIEAAKNG